MKVAGISFEDGLTIPQSVFVLTHAQVAVRREQIAIQHVRVKGLIGVKQTLAQGRFFIEATDGVFEFLETIKVEALSVTLLSLFQELSSVTQVLRRC